MNPIRKAFSATTAALKRLTLVFGRTAYTSLGYFFRGSGYDYTKYVGDGTENSAVQNCLAWIGRAFPEAPVRVMRAKGDDYESVAGHPMVELLEQPNPYYSGAVLWMATLTSFHVDGNGYWLKERAAGGRVVGLWWVPHTLMTPVSESPTTFIEYYEYAPVGGQKPIRVSPDDVVHFRNGLDPKNPRLGRAPLKAALREVFSDDEAANFFSALLHNMGIPGVLIAPDTETALMTKDDADAVRADYMALTSGDNRGMPFVLPAKTKVEIMSFSPEQLDLSELRKLPEERISGALGVPAIVAGLGAGLDRSTFSNYEEARAAAWEDNILPTQRIIAADLKTQLLDDFGDTAGMRVEFDTSQVRVLQPDQTALFTRTLLAMEKGAIMVSEARREMGFTSGPEHEVYLIPGRSPVSNLLDLIAEPAPEPVSVPEPSTLPALPAPGETDDAVPPAPMRLVAGG